MNTKFNKIVKTGAVGIVFMALLINVKLSLTDPFLRIGNEVLAQTTTTNPCSPGSSNSYGGVCCQVSGDCQHPYTGLVYYSVWKSCVSTCS